MKMHGLVSRISTLGLGLVLCLQGAAGCGGDDDGGGDTAAGTEGTGSGTGSGTTPSTMSNTSAPGTSGMDASASGDDVVDDTSDTMPPTTGDPTTGGPTTGDPTTGGPATGDDSTGDPTTGGAAGVCDPDGDDDACAECVKSMCCTELEACAADVDCTCFQDCVELNPGQLGAFQCSMDCNVMLFGEGPTADLVGCSSGQATCGPVCV